MLYMYLKVNDFNADIHQFSFTNRDIFEKIYFRPTKIIEHGDGKINKKYTHLIS